MGLRLYQAPVESDIQFKLGANKRDAQPRSVIRRAIPPRNNTVRGRLERRRRVLTVAAASYSDNPSADQSHQARTITLETLEPPVDSSAIGDSNATGNSRRPVRRALRNVVNRMDVLNDRVATMFGERWAQLHADSNPSPLRDEDNDDNSGPEARRLARLAPPTEPYTVSNIRSTQALEQYRNGGSMRVSSQRALRPLSRSADQLRALEANAEQSQASSHRDVVLQSFLESPQLDGLGDRNRSLSPEGDHVWDTLLSTLTPDPQAPSVGSSFASTSASAVASQSAPTGSSGTSFTSPDTADESAFEPPCESGCENSDTEGDEDEEMEQNTLTRFPSSRRDNDRSYADVTQSNGGEDFLEYLGGIGGMQRIVRNLARREDIPDEWWAEAGLNRTLSPETSTT